MEQEEFHLTVKYSLREKPDSDKIVCHSEVIGCTIQRSRREGQKYKRICVDFDPSTKDVGYVLGMLITKNVGGVNKHHFPKHLFVYPSELLAQEGKSELMKEYKVHLEAGEKLESVEIWPCLITTI